VDIDFDFEKGVIRISEGSCGAVFFVVEDLIDPEQALYFEAGDSGRCVSFDPPAQQSERGALLEALLAFARSHGLIVKGEELPEPPLK
jgi:hypothetical protein